MKKEIKRLKKSTEEMWKSSAERWSFVPKSKPVNKDWLNRKDLYNHARKSVNKDTKIVTAFIIVLAISGYILLKSFNYLN